MVRVRDVIQDGRRSTVVTYGDGTEEGEEFDLDRSIEDDQAMVDSVRRPQPVASLDISPVTMPSSAR